VGVGCRVGPGVTSPAPPQSRTCSIRASGSSVTNGLRPPSLAAGEPEATPFTSGAQLGCPTALCWLAVDTIRGLGVPLVVPTSSTLCPVAPSLPWVAWASLPHLQRYYEPLRLPIAHLRFLRFVARPPIPCQFPFFVSRGLTTRPAAHWRVGTPALSPAFSKETIGSPKFPSCPHRHMPRSQTPVVSPPPRPSGSGAAAFRRVESVGFPAPL
jgi:hypothetical protein